MKRTQIPPAERAWRSQLSHLLSFQPFLHASMEVRHRACGKPTCHCATGEKHTSLYLVRSRAGSREQLFVPRHQEDEVRQWVANYQHLLRLLERVSDTAWNRVGKKKES
jgi:hypothetical protein